MKSVISFPDRGPWGDSKWRGNCSGHVIRELIEHYRPEFFVDACEGSGTSGDVCKDFGVQYVGLDLHRGFDFTRDSILNHLPRRADVCFTHAPYFDMVKYSDIGRFDNPVQKQQDLSSTSNEDEFLELSQCMLMNQRLATKGGGIYTTLIGDMRRKGFGFRSFQADYISMMPREELEAVVIKAQHNCVSDNRTYSGSYVPITHEYLLIWRKKTATMLQVTTDLFDRLTLRQQWTWKTLVRLALMHYGGKATLEQLYALIGKMTEATDKIQKNHTWPATVRRTLQQNFEHIDRGVWALAS